MAILIRDYNVQLTQIAYINLESTKAAIVNDLYELAEVASILNLRYLFLDEIQRHRGEWAQALRDIQDDFPTLQVIIAGSERDLLKRGLQKSTVSSGPLYGRTAQFHIRPMSFQEYLVAWYCFQYFNNLARLRLLTIIMCSQTISFLPM